MRTYEGSTRKSASGETDEEERKAHARELPSLLGRGGPVATTPVETAFDGPKAFVPASDCGGEQTPAAASTRGLGTGATRPVGTAEADTVADTESPLVGRPATLSAAAPTTATPSHVSRSFAFAFLAGGGSDDRAAPSPAGSDDVFVAAVNIEGCENSIGPYKSVLLIADVVSVTACPFSCDPASGRSIAFRLVEPTSMTAAFGVDTGRVGGGKLALMGADSLWIVEAARADWEKPVSTGAVSLWAVEDGRGGGEKPVSTGAVSFGAVEVGRENWEKPVPAGAVSLGVVEAGRTVGEKPVSAGAVSFGPAEVGRTCGKTPSALFLMLSCLVCCCCATAAATRREASALEIFAFISESKLGCFAIGARLEACASWAAPTKFMGDLEIELSVPPEGDDSFFFLGSISGSETVSRCVIDSALRPEDGAGRW